mgnify:FL=1
MVITDGLKSVIGNQINLPLIGAVSVPIAIGGAIILFMLLRKKRVTSVTTRYGR